ncbi:MAG: DNA-3-methyladenine glycosylase 2 family protein [Myxococcales bacterium]|nr:DNA-3-methyladenine glycosylase 2 family protein [Myxococcales bacterium]
MRLEADRCYAALRARDARFDGLFFVGVETTGVYCRPICPARLPAKERCRFFGTAAEAEHEGFRACFRCRPEVAPGAASVDARSRLVQVAASMIAAGFLNDHSLDDLATRLGVSARHLRRTVEAELGVTPIAYAQTRRLALAKQLLHDTTMPLADLAFAAGFSSVRRFNALFRARFGRPPSEVRRAQLPPSSGEGLRLRLDFRPPYEWERLLTFLEARAIPGVEAVSPGEYRRSVRLADVDGWLVVRPALNRDALEARVSLSLAPRLMPIVAGLRALFDLDARPAAIADHLGGDSRLRASVSAHPGLRIPGAFDGFEVAVRAVLGQQISVRGATTLAGRLVERFGRPSSAPIEGCTRLFPVADEIAALSAQQIRAIGLPSKRAETIVGLAQAVARGDLSLSLPLDPERAVASLQHIPGIGPWTAHYIAMRVFAWPDAFPAGDLVLRRALGVVKTREADERAQPWRPFRAYAVFHLWNRSTASDNS